MTQEELQAELSRRQIVQPTSDTVPVSAYAALLGELALERSSYLGAIEGWRSCAYECDSNENKLHEAKDALLRLKLEEHLWKMNSLERVALVDLYNVLGLPIPKSNAN